MTDHLRDYVPYSLFADVDELCCVFVAVLGSKVRCECGVVHGRRATVQSGSLGVRFV